MYERKATFETEGEATAFVEGLQAMHGLLDLDGGQPDFTYDAFSEDDRWTVVYSFVV